MIGLLIALIIFGFCLWLVSLIPMDPTVRKVIFGLAILFLILYILQAFGLFTMPGLKIR